MGHKEQRIFRYIWIPLSIAAIGLVLYFIAGRVFAGNIAAQISYVAVQGEPRNVSSNGIEFSEVSEGNVDEAEIIMPSAGEQYGEIRCDAFSEAVPLYYGDTDDVIGDGTGENPGKGAGQSLLSGLPGQGKTILVGAHDTTYFGQLKDVHAGDSIVLACTYGTFEYTVSKIDIIDGADYTVSDDKEQLVLYTCYPFGEVGKDRTEKIVYICDKVSGPVIGGSEVGQ